MKRWKGLGKKKIEKLTETRREGQEENIIINKGQKSRKEEIWKCKK